MGGQEQDFVLVDFNEASPRQRGRPKCTSLPSPVDRKHSKQQEESTSVRLFAERRSAVAQVNRTGVAWLGPLCWRVASWLVVASWEPMMSRRIVFPLRACNLFCRNCSRFQRGCIQCTLHPHRTCHRWCTDTV
ncbi:hypothetical protein H310_12810 [Aphanomyces invadans]|uniref:Uncharacterized protein n=1 Tax=Aphanomyces invadans TaxID=157072 RepID=A0A024TIM0_9STRA|nr:hypothetical protein H310_12810 [Aphanomyces invadans]ETV93212.1 hypothetical protein H310_12810 [Aphanomyces invadans]|eukprot:XP_008878234.1 hypothetical protein H310_12810 [Aphanomyces invadans]